jgi:hypothetical protein
MGLRSWLLPSLLVVAIPACSRPDPPTLTAAPSAKASAAAPVAGDGPIIVDLKPSDGPLKTQVAREKERAGARTLILQTTASWCRPCIGLKKSMPDPLMKDALRNVRLVRIDIDDFSKEEVESIELSAASIPWFVKLDANMHPADAITSDEWGDDIAPNMAPVLGAFVKGTFTKRKHTWQPGRWI